MILPGVSGGYLLLVLGVYVPILAGVDEFKEGLRALDLEVIGRVGLAVVLPVGLGVVGGMVGVSNLLRWLLKRYEKATLGVLLGLLVGAVVGLWPFQQTAEPTEGQLIKARAVTFGPPTLEGLHDPAAVATWIYEESGEPVEPEDLPTEFFTPTAAQAGGAAGLILLGLGATLLIDRLGREKKPG
jgi:putative membrane protein